MLTGKQKTRIILTVHLMLGDKAAKAINFDSLTLKYIEDPNKYNITQKEEGFILNYIFENN